MAVVAVNKRPLYVDALLALFSFGLVISFGFWLYYYTKSSTLREAWEHNRETLEAKRLDTNGQTSYDVDPNIEASKQDAQAKAGKILALNDAAADEAGSIKSLLEAEKGHVESMRANVALLKENRRQKLQDAKVAREDLSHEEKMRTEASISHEEALSKQRLLVKQLSKDLEREQKAYRSKIYELEKVTDRLDKRMQELLHQKNVNKEEMKVDGQIIAARADMGFVVIDIGWVNNLRAGTKFQVTNLRGGKKIIKGEIEVLSVKENQAHARVLEEKYKNDPIISGDKLHNPIFDPKEIKVFTIKGTFERYSRDELKRFIEEAGAVVDKDLSTRTDYLIVGFTGAEKALQEAKNYGVVVLSESKLIDFIRMPTE